MKTKFVCVLMNVALWLFGLSLQLSAVPVRDRAKADTRAAINLLRDEILTLGEIVLPNFAQKTRDGKRKSMQRRFEELATELAIRQGIRFRPYLLPPEDEGVTTTQTFNRRRDKVSREFLRDYFFASEENDIARPTRILDQYRYIRDSLSTLAGLVIEGRDPEEQLQINSARKADSELTPSSLPEDQSFAQVNAHFIQELPISIERGFFPFNHSDSADWTPTPIAYVWSIADQAEPAEEDLDAKEELDESEAKTSEMSIDNRYRLAHRSGPPSSFLRSPSPLPSENTTIFSTPEYLFAQAEERREDFDTEGLLSDSEPMRSASPCFFGDTTELFLP